VIRSLIGRNREANYGTSNILMSAFGVRRENAALSCGCKTHPVTAPTGSSRSSYGGDEIAEAFVAPGKIQEGGTRM
jgi:hypothetical protein